MKRFIRKWLPSWLYDWEMIAEQKVRLWRVTRVAAEMDGLANLGGRCLDEVFELAQFEAEWNDFAIFVACGSIPYFETRRDEKFDLIFLDGDHAAATVYREVPAALRALKPGGYLLLHDYFPDLRPIWSNGAVIPGPYLAIRRLQAEGLDVQVLPLGTLPWPTKVGSNLTSLALLGRR